MNCIDDSITKAAEAVRFFTERKPVDPLQSINDAAERFFAPSSHYGVFCGNCGHAARYHLTPDGRIMACDAPNRPYAEGHICGCDKFTPSPTLRETASQRNARLSVELRAMGDEEAEQEQDAFDREMDRREGGDE